VEEEGLERSLPLKKGPSRTEKKFDKRCNTRGKKMVRKKKNLKNPNHTKPSRRVAGKNLKTPLRKGETTYGSKKSVEGSR